MPGCDFSAMSITSANNNYNNNDAPKTTATATATPQSAPTPPPIRNQYDERNMKFCGPTWNDANDLCDLSTWCPTGTECDETKGYVCWGGVANCNAFVLKEYEGVVGVNNHGMEEVEEVPMPPPLLEQEQLPSSEQHQQQQQTQVTDNNNQQHEQQYDPTQVNNPNALSTNNECGSEVYQCKSGEFVSRDPKLSCGFRPCPVTSPSTTMTTTVMSVAPTAMETFMFPTYMPTLPVELIPVGYTTTMTPTNNNNGIDDENENVVVVASTIPPSTKPTVWSDNDPNNDNDLYEYVIANNMKNEVDTNNNQDNVESNTESNGMEEEEAPTTNLWCGENRFDSTRNCGRYGYACPDGYCIQNLSCYRVGRQCETTEVEEGTLPQNDDPTLTLVPTAVPSSLPSVMEIFTNVPSSNPTEIVVNTLAPSHSPTRTPKLPEMYCARSMEELETSCTTAQECVTRGCPLGHMCFSYECNAEENNELDDNTTLSTSTTTLAPSSSIVTNSPTVLESSGALEWYCASTFEELESTCSSTAERCVYERQDCPSGQWCYQFYCNTAVVEDAVVEDTVMEDAVVEDTVVESEVIDETPVISDNSNDVVDQPPSKTDETRYCASSITQLHDQCGLAVPCTTDKNCIFQGETCMTYDCRQNLMQCPLNFVGWHSSKDCKEYYHCEKGVATSPNKCGEDGLKFDKSRGVCTFDYVDEFCYGLDSYEHDSSSPLTQPGTSKAMCPPGFTGWHSSDGGCNEYQRCISGIPGPTRVCGNGLKFVTTRGECISESLVNTPTCREHPPKPKLCPWASLKGWGVRNNCKEYFYCENGSADFVRRCFDGTLFDIQSGSCQPTSTVNCGGKVITNPSPRPTILGGTNAHNSFEWNDTSPPTTQPPTTGSRIPPWMVFKQDLNDAMRTDSLQVGLFAIASVCWMLL